MAPSFSCWRAISTALSASVTSAFHNARSHNTSHSSTVYFSFNGSSGGVASTASEANLIASDKSEACIVVLNNWKLAPERDWRISPEMRWIVKVSIQGREGRMGQKGKWKGVYL